MYNIYIYIVQCTICICIYCTYKIVYFKQMCVHEAQCAVSYDHQRLVCAITCPAIIMTPLDASTRTIWTFSSSSSSIIIASSSQRRLMFLVLVFSSKQRVIHRSVMNRFSSTDHAVETSF